MLRRAIQSVADQSYLDWTQIIVNDGGNETVVKEIVSEFASDIREKIIIIHNSISLGMERASNIGLERATGYKYVLIHDDDDTLKTSFLEQTVNFLESTEGQNYAGVATKVTKISEEIIGDEIKFVSSDTWNKSFNCIRLSDFVEVNQIVPISFLYRNDVHKEIGYYNEKLPVLGDWEFYLRFLEKFDIHLINEELANYHHRVTLTEGIYSNTIYSGKQLHEQYDAYIRNYFYKRDCLSGNVGIGHLLNYSKLANKNNSIQMIEQSKQTILRQLLNNRINSVIMYGTGEYAKGLYKLLTNYNIKVLNFIDKDPNKWGKELFSIKVLPLQEAIYEHKHDAIVIASYSFIEEIVERVRKELEIQNADSYIVSA